MTTVSCTPVKTAGHLAACAGYLENEKAVMTAGWNIDPARWHDEMRRTMAAYGHDVSGRAGTEPTLAYHEQLAFLPDECSQNGGPVGEREAMAFAWEYYTRVYPAQEVFVCLHDEGDRYCAHAIVGRTDLSTGRRHDRGAPEALERRRQVKDELDDRFGLEHVMNLREKEEQMVYGPVSYSNVRARSREVNAERMAAKQGRSYKQQLFRDCARAMRGATTLSQYKEELKAKGYGVRETKRGLTYTVRNARGQERTFTDRAMRPARLSTEDVRHAVNGNAYQKHLREAEKRLAERIRGHDSGFMHNEHDRHRSSDSLHHDCQQHNHDAGRSR
ncbi:MAG: hypothetical protein E7Z99_09960 [Coriobacteriaceae bacterium]|jgi:hypothetical protein|uniref:relaxase/mobilization nuclease domain-containing protein n=1 Tax=Denitrobacterium detoxificans TaxID=79604 RepID=UPI001DDE3C93|nr:relaxase/mobilization nuclease domain-containing protein [Denitrobacterium detoxificans]MBE6465283.1 hypothetical protein [Denitrobacterium detoxificans]MBE6471633.1 hypothetical protein [Coriobacteriaceae bacterium]MBE6473859.1 hypothetical protein [Coriobacteriaceae bacterium]